MIPIPRPEKEPTFRDAVKKIVQEESKVYNESVRRLEADTQGLKKVLADAKDRGPISVDIKKLDSMESTLKTAMADMRQKFSSVISEQEARIADNAKAIRALETRLAEAAGKGAKGGGGSPKDMDDVRTDLKTLEKNVFEQFNQMHKMLDDLSTSLTAKTRDFDAAMGRLARFQDEARALNSDNFIRDVSALKMRVDRAEAALTELKSREPVIIE